MEYRLIRSKRKTVSIQITPGGEILVRCPQRMKKEAVEAFVKSKEDWIRRHMPDPGQVLPAFSQAELLELKRQAGEDLPGRVARLAKILGADYGTVTLRYQKTRWGSCTGKGNLNFNCLLMLTPPQVRDYVVIHELCHRKHLNHSAQFWAEVERHCPDYRVHRKWLKDNGGSLISRLP